MSADRLTAYYDRALDLCGLLVGAAIALLAVLVSVEVALRASGLGNLPWLVEVAEYGLFLGTFLAAPWVLRLGAHVRVDVALEVLPRGLARLVEFAADAIGLVSCAVLGWYGARACIDAYRQDLLIFKDLIVAEWWLLWMVPFSCLLLAVEFLRRLRRALRDGGADPSPARQTRGL